MSPWRARLRVLLEAKAPKPETPPKKIRGFDPSRAEGIGSGLATNFIHNRTVEHRYQREIAEAEAHLARLKEQAASAQQWRDRPVKK